MTERHSEIHFRGMCLSRCGLAVSWADWAKSRGPGVPNS